MTGSAALLDNAVSSFFGALATYEGLKTSTALLDGSNQLDVLIQMLLAIVALNFVVWKADSIPFAALREWINGIYNPFNGFLMLVIVRVADEFVFDSVGPSAVSILADPIIVIGIVQGGYIVIKYKLGWYPAEDKVKQCNCQCKH